MAFKTYYQNPPKKSNSITRLHDVARDLNIIHSFDVEYVERHWMDSKTSTYNSMYPSWEAQTYVDAIVTIKATAEDLLDVFSFYQNVRPTNDPAVKKAFDEYMLVKALHTERLGGV